MRLGILVLSGSYQPTCVLCSSLQYSSLMQMQGVSVVFEAVATYEHVICAITLLCGMIDGLSLGGPYFRGSSNMR